MENFAVIVVCFSLGYFLKRFRVFPSSYAQAFVDFILFVAFPAMIVLTLHRLLFRIELIGFIFLGLCALGVGVTLSWMVGKLLGWEEKTIRTVAMMSAFGNTSFVGFPFVRALVGEEGIAYAVVYDQFVSFLPLILLSPLIMGGAKGKESFAALIKFPPFVAVIVGIVLHDVTLPLIVTAPLELLAKTVIPLILIAVGMNFVLGDVAHHKKGIATILGIKMVALPLLMIMALNLFGVSLLMMWQVGILEAAMPPMVTASIFVAQKGLNKELASASVGVGILLAFVTLPLWWSVIG